MRSIIFKKSSDYDETLSFRPEVEEDVFSGYLWYEEKAAQFIFNRIVGLQTGACMTGKGFRILLDRVSGSGGEGSLYLKRSVTYFEVPLLLRTVFLKKRGSYGGFAFHLFGGGAINKVVSAKEYLYAKYVYKDPYTGQITGRKTDDIDEVDLMKEKVLADTLGNRFIPVFLRRFLSLE